jgi:isoquinoline 1-oxidoreductase alpha subunit
MIQFQVNSNPVTFDGPVDTPLLWVLRDHLGLSGTKFGCGIGRCGACTVHIGGAAQTACTVRVGALAGARVTTIEGLAAAPGLGQGPLHPVQQAWIEEDVPQCGYCQPGQIMAAVDLLSRLPDPSDADIDRHMTNLCRCGTYVRIRKAIHRAAALLAETSS